MSTSSVRCECGADIDYEPSDDACDAYCPSCGRACAIPAAVLNPTAADVEGSESAAQRRTSKIFSASGAAVLRDRVAYTSECRCGGRTPVLVSEVGAAVYCPTCGAELLPPDKNAAVSLQAAIVEPPRSKQTPMRRSKRIVSVVTLLTAIALVAIYWKTTSTAPTALDVGPPQAIEELPVTIENVRALLDLEDIESAVVRADRMRALLTKQGVAADDPIALELRRVREVLANRPQYITSPRIAALETRLPYTAALTQAGIWSDVLGKANVGKDDPRLPQLRSVIDSLVAKLYPPQEQGSSSFVVFHRLLAQLTQQLESHQTAEAEATVQECEQLLTKLGSDGEPLRERYDRLLESLERERTRNATIRQIHDQLENASAILKGDDTRRYGEAIDLFAKARFRAFQSPLLPDEFRDLDDRVRGLLSEIRFARGRRALDDAVRLEAEKNVVARQRVVAQAAAYFSGIEESQTAPYIHRLRPWLVEKATVVKETPPVFPKHRPATTPYDDEIQVRDAYELALESYAKGRAVEFVTAAAPIDAWAGPPDGDVFVTRNPPSGWASALRAKLPELVYDQTEYVAVTLRNGENSTVDLDQLRRLLNDADRSWRTSPRRAGVAETLRLD